MSLALPSALARRGLQVECLPGWGTRGIGTMRARGSIAHWTAGPRYNGDPTRRPSLAIVTNGKSRGLDNALCNVYLDRAGIAVVVAARVAWHGGVGSWRGVSGNDAWYGTEAEGAGPGDFTPAQIAAYPRVIAGIHDITETDPALWAIAHSDYAPTRKVDVGNAYMQAFRAEAARIWRTPPGTQTSLIEAQTNALLSEEETMNMLHCDDPRYGIVWVITADLTHKTPLPPGEFGSFKAAVLAGGGKVTPVALGIATLDRIPGSTVDVNIVSK